MCLSRFPCSGTRSNVWHCHLSLPTATCCYLWSPTVTYCHLLLPIFSYCHLLSPLVTYGCLSSLTVIYSPTTWRHIPEDLILFNYSYKTACAFLITSKNVSFYKKYMSLKCVIFFSQELLLKTSTVVNIGSVFYLKLIGCHFLSPLLT